MSFCGFFRGFLSSIIDCCYNLFFLFFVDVFRCTPCISFVFQVLGTIFCNAVFCFPPRQPITCLQKCKVNVQRLSFFLISLFPFRATFLGQHGLQVSLLELMRLVPFPFDGNTACSLRTSLLGLTLLFILLYYQYFIIFRHNIAICVELWYNVVEKGGQTERRLVAFKNSIDLQVEIFRLLRAV